MLEVEGEERVQQILWIWRDLMSSDSGAGSCRYIEISIEYIAASSYLCVLYTLECRL